MKHALGLCAVALGAWFVQAEVMAEDANVPNLVGTWTGPFKAMREHGIADGTLTLRVTEQDGPLLKAEKSWKSPGVPGDVGGKEVEAATEPLVGVIDFTGRACISPSRPITVSTVGDSRLPTRSSSSISRPATQPLTGCGSRAESSLPRQRGWRQARRRRVRAKSAPNPQFFRWNLHFHRKIPGESADKSLRIGDFPGN